MSDRYLDIINKPYKKSTRHPHMKMEDRAAQFAPFAALVGYDDEIAEAKRLTESKQELSDEAKAIISNKINILLDCITERPLVNITYFVKDKLKAGGMYRTKSTTIRKIDEQNKLIILEDRDSIAIDNIIDITGAIFNIYDNQDYL